MLKVSALFIAVNTLMRLNLNGVNSDSRDTYDHKRFKPSGLVDGI